MAKTVKKAKKANTKKAKKSASKSKPKKAVSRAKPAAAAELILVAKNVPESKVGVTTDGFINAGATKVAKKKEAKGKYTLTAAFPR